MYRLNCFFVRLFCKKSISLDKPFTNLLFVLGYDFGFTSYIVQNYLVKNGSVKVKDFLEEMKQVAAESYRVLKKDKFCAVLMGDTRKNGYMVPMSFEVMRIFEDAGFKLKELTIKEQHNCKATGYLKTNSVKYNFLLIAHEYLFVFRK